MAVKVMKVKAKKHLGQHFLEDKTVCKKMTDSLCEIEGIDTVLEVGPGMGALTQFLLAEEQLETHVVEVDAESVDYLNLHYPKLKDRIYSRDFLRMDLTELMGDRKFAVAGNFPYNISSQILFKVLDFKDQIPVVVGMFQKEVAERIAEKPGTKKYGIISVLLQAYYDIEYLFTVPPEVFDPPPKVNSGVIRLVRNKIYSLPCDEKKFKQIVKTAFNQRRKTMRNSLKSFLNEYEIDHTKHAELFARRPETLSVNEFIELTKLFS